MATEELKTDENAGDKVREAMVEVLRVLVPLYLARGVGKKDLIEASKLEPHAAIVLAVMGFANATYATAIEMLLYGKFFGRRECKQLVEEGLLALESQGYIKFADAAEKERWETQHDRSNWGLGDLQFVLTAKGANRICFLVGTFTDTPWQEVQKNMRAESTAKAKAHLKRIRSRGRKQEKA